MGMLPTTQEIPLQYPVKVDDAEVKALTLRRPKVRDQLMVQQDGIITPEGEAELFAHLCEVSPETIHELDLADYANLQAAYTGFLANSAASAPETSGA